MGVMRRDVICNMDKYSNLIYSNSIYNYFNIVNIYVVNIASFILFNMANIVKDFLDTILKIIYIVNNVKTVNQNE